MPGKRQARKCFDRRGRGKTVLNDWTWRLRGKTAWNVLYQGVEAREAADLMGKIGIGPGLMRGVCVGRRDFQRVNQRRDGLAQEEGDLFANGGDLEDGTTQDRPASGGIVGLCRRAGRQGIRAAGERFEKAADLGMAEIAGGERANPQDPNALAGGVGEGDGPGAVEKPCAVELGGLHDLIDGANGVIEVGWARRRVRGRQRHRQWEPGGQILKDSLNSFDAVRRLPERPIHPAQLIQHLAAVFGMRPGDVRFFGDLPGEMADSQVRIPGVVLARAGRTAMGPDATGE